MPTDQSSPGRTPRLHADPWAAQTADLVVLGAGIVGLAAAHTVLRHHPGRRVVVLDKETGPAAHQSGHNSGVIHSGIYYAPGSLKARTCRDGAASMMRFAREHGIDAAITGKLIVATSRSELDGLERLERRGLEHGLTVTRLDAAGVREHEPHVSAVAGLHVAETGIIDFPAVCDRLVELIEKAGARVLWSNEVIGLEWEGSRTRVLTDHTEIDTARVLNCTGLQVDRVARLGGDAPEARIVPFRGEYRTLRPSATHLVRGLVYPVPDPDFPFLGVHLTRGIDGRVHAGPNAVLALSREGYRWRDLSVRDVAGTLAYPGFRALARKHLGQGGQEMLRSIWPPLFLRSLRKLVPELTHRDLERSPAGVRAQAVRVNGTLVDDFLIDEGIGMLHVLNAPSPAATASLEIAEELVRRLDLDGRYRL
jgi:L-2-hydroxyglutarate oxidase